MGTAREWLRIGHALAKLPILDTAFASGTLSYAKVRELTRVAIDHPDHQAALVELAVPLASGELSRALSRWCERHDDPDDRRRRQKHVDEHDHAPRGRRHRGADGPLARSGDGAHQGRQQKRRSLNQQRALALLDLVANGTGSRVDTEILVHVRADGCTLHDGTPLETSTVAKLVDTAFVRALIHDAEGRPINASGRQRFPTDRQKRVVDERVQRCIDCDTTELLEYDHDLEFAVSEHTVVEELTCRCSACHRKRHAA